MAGLDGLAWGIHPIIRIISYGSVAIHGLLRMAEVGQLVPSSWPRL
jgi:hypothetical protein